MSITNLFTASLDDVKDVVDVRNVKLHDALDRTRTAQNELNAAIAAEHVAYYELAEARTAFYYRKGKDEGARDSARQIMADYVEEFGGTVS